VNSLIENFIQFSGTLPENICLVAVSKNKQVSAIESIYKSGHRIFGENRVQELVNKAQDLPSDIDWHMIGHLQTNKVKYIAPFVSLIQSVDSLKLLRVIDKEALSNSRIIRCLLQIHIADEETKYGLDKSELIQLLESDDFSRLKHVRIDGLMGMATFTDDQEKVRKEFKSLKHVFDDIKQKYFYKNEYFNQLSMGMSSDYKLALEEGSTMIRIGSMIFGESK